MTYMIRSNGIVYVEFLNVPDCANKDNNTFEMTSLLQIESTNQCHQRMVKKKMPTVSEHRSFCPPFLKAQTGPMKSHDASLTKSDSKKANFLKCSLILGRCNLFFESVVIGSCYVIA
jgi:hypothetical protein